MDLMRPMRWRCRCTLPVTLLVIASLLPLTIAQGAEAPAGLSPDGETAAPDSSVIFRSYRTYAREDTIEIPLTYIYGEYVDVEARRVSLEEIIDRAIEAERTRYDDVDDMQFTMTEKAVAFYGSSGDTTIKREFMEGVTRCYVKQPDMHTCIQLGERKRTSELEGGEMKLEEEEPDIEVAVSTGRSDLTDLPFFFSELSDYDFEIVERHDLEERVLYRISFTPRSDFKPRPTGEFWIDTHDFRIFYIWMKFDKNVPVPIFLKAVDHVAIEMERIDGFHVYKRISFKVRLRKIPLIGLPPLIEGTVTFDDYVFNQGLPDDIFEEE